MELEDERRTDSEPCVAYGLVLYAWREDPPQTRRIVLKVADCIGRCTESAALYEGLYVALYWVQTHSAQTVTAFVTSETMSCREVVSNSKITTELIDSADDGKRIQCEKTIHEIPRSGRFHLLFHQGNIEACRLAEERSNPRA